LQPPIRIMHFADTHFGVEAYGRLDPASGMNSRLIDFRDTLLRAIDTALEAGIHLALFAGDAYRSREPSQTHQREFALCIRRLTENGVPVVLLTGNHDIPNVAGRAHAMEIYRTLGVENVTVISKPGVMILDTSAGRVQIAGMPYITKGFVQAREEFVGKTADEIRQLMETKYSEQLNMLASDLDSALPTVLMGHFWVRDARLSSWQHGYFNVNEPRVALGDLARQGAFDYVALGHIHKFQDLNGGSQPPVVYCGSPDYIDFGEREEDKGFVLVNLEKGNTTFEHVRLPGRRELLEIEADADGDDPTSQILEEIARHNLENNIVRLTYRTTSDKLPLIREKEIREALAPAFMVIAIRRDVHRDSASRSPCVTEALEPLSALGYYMDSSDKGKARKGALMPYAERLYEELLKEETVL
jgi:exonuclease SbcD